MSHAKPIFFFIFPHNKHISTPKNHVWFDRLYLGGLFPGVDVDEDRAYNDGHNNTSSKVATPNPSKNKKKATRELGKTTPYDEKIEY